MLQSFTITIIATFFYMAVSTVSGLLSDADNLTVLVLGGGMLFFGSILGLMETLRCVGSSLDKKEYKEDRDTLIAAIKRERGILEIMEGLSQYPESLPDNVQNDVDRLIVEQRKTLKVLTTFEVVN